MNAEKVFYDFLVGGGLIAVVLAIASILSPFIGGLIAVIPIRLGLTIFIAGISSDASFTSEIARGGLTGSLSACIFVVSLSYSAKRIGVWRGFCLSWVLCLAFAISVLVLS